MSRITYNADSLKIMFLFEKTTRIRLKDFFVDDNNLTSFVVAKEDLGKAIGKNGINVKTISYKLQKQIKIIEYNPDLVKFVENSIYPIKAVITLENNNIKIIIATSPIPAKIFFSIIFSHFLSL